jgi:alpha-mannosidase
MAASFLNLDGDGVDLETLKPAEDGNGYIVRLLETGGKTAVARLSSSLLAIDGAWRCNAVEDNQQEMATKDGGLEITLSPYSIVTLRLLLRRAAP